MNPRLSKPLLAAAGILFTTLGIIGVFLPLLPTTPFLLLAAACFVRSSERLYRWLIHHRWFGTYIRNYREYHAITLRTKIVTLVLLWGTIGYSAFAVVENLPIRILLIAVAIGVTLHILRMGTLTRDMLESKEKDTTEK